MRISQFNLLTAALIALLAAAVAFAGSVGKAHDSPLDVFFTNPDGSLCQQPCLFGVRLGETRVDRALMLLKLHPLTGNLKVLYKETDEFTLTGADVWLYARISRSKIITYLSISHITAANGERLPAGSPDLIAAFQAASPGAFLSRFGAPASTTFTAQTMNGAIQTLAQMQYLDPHMRASHYTISRAGQAYLDIDAELQDIEVYASELELGQTERGGQPWLGFTNAARYEAPETP